MLPFIKTKIFHTLNLDRTEQNTKEINVISYLGVSQIIMDDGIQFHFTATITSTHLQRFVQKELQLIINNDLRESTTWYVTRVEAVFSRKLDNVFSKTYSIFFGQLLLLLHQKQTQLILSQK